MNHLTNYYRNLCEQLQEKVNYLENLLEAGEMIFKDETPRNVLYRRYGKAKADELIQSIRDRETKLGSDHPDVKKARAEFAIPDYSDKSLDTPFSVTGERPSAEASKSREGNYEVTWAAQAYSNKNKIEMNLNDPKSVSSAIDELQIPGTEPDVGTPTSTYDLLGHEVTHILQKNRESILPDKERSWPKDSSTPRKGYTQNPYEPAARMAELKHNYFKQTGKLLKADMTDDDYNNFEKWYKETQQKVDPANPEKGRRGNPEKDDTMEVIRSPEGRELFRRVAIKTPTDTGTMQA